MLCLLGKEEFLNEIVWCYSQGGRSKRWFGRKHDVIFWYSKSKKYLFNSKDLALEYTPHKQDASGKNYGGRMGVDENGREYVEKWGTGKKKLYRYYLDEGKIPEDYWVDINSLQSGAQERMGYPTQKPEALLERIIKASSNEGDVVLDAYCGCGTTVAVAERLNRQWIGIDITYHSISLILKRLVDGYGESVLSEVKVDGIPQDMASARALANREDDRVRKEFEKWAALTYTNNRAAINEKKGADKGIDGIVYFASAPGKTERMVIQVKSGGANRGTIATLKGDMQRENAELATLITMDEPTRPMIEEAKNAGQYEHVLMGRKYDRIRIVTVADMIVNGARLVLPLSYDAVNPVGQRKMMVSWFGTVANDIV